jgi:archaellum biogenesis protein FlaJ (TadC family)
MIFPLLILYRGAPEPASIIDRRNRIRQFQAMQALYNFFHDFAAWILAISVLSFIIGMISIPMLVARIPVDYFTHHTRHRLANSSRHPLLQLLLACLKNAFGAVLIVMGIVMLFTPGQGLLTILFGLMLMNYPGKYLLERWIISRPLIFRSVNNLREKKGQPPLLDPN